MIIVSDTSPITNLMIINEVELLKDVFGTIIIPEGVQEELQRIDKQRKQLEQLNWIRVQKVKNSKLVAELRLVLDKGESEAIALAVEKKASYLIIDERKGRKIAIKYGLRITGLIGVLSQAKSKGYINKVKPFLENLTLLSGFRVSPELKKQVLDDLGE